MEGSVLECECGWYVKSGTCRASLYRKASANAAAATKATTASFHTHGYAGDR
jgi:hypothetical protein